MKNRFFLSIALLITLNILVYGQKEKVEHDVIFGNRIDNSVTIEVQKGPDKYTFYSNNRSYYPYLVELNISNIKNLNPSYVSKSFRVSYGKSQLIDLRIEDPESQVDYQFNYSYSLSLRSSIDEDYPYLIPVKNKFELDIIDGKQPILIRNTFKINVKDTIYCMRKGYVAAVPDMYNKIDRISRNNSLEIIHRDGSVMIYENIDPNFCFVDIGKTTYPGQPLGFINANSQLYVKLIKGNGDSKLRSVNFKYIVSNNLVEFSESLKDLQIHYPTDIIQKEMSKREIKKMKKNRLY